MRIGINAQLLSFEQSYRQAGLSRYIYELVTRLPLVTPRHRYLAFTPPVSAPSSFPGALPSNLVLRQSRIPTQRALVRIPWEQTILPAAALASRLDLLFSPVNVRPLLATCPSVVTVHDLIFLRRPEAFKPAKRLYLRLMTGWSVRRAACVIAVSEATRRDVIELLRVPPRRVVTVHNGVGEQFRPIPESERESFRASKDLTGRVLLYVGTLEPRKNLKLLIQSVARLSEDHRYDDVTLLVGGSKGWYYQEVFAEVEKLHLGGRVRFLGRLPDEELPLWYNVAAIFAYPSLYEGFGLPALEAMSCGTPVVTSNTSSFPEVVGDAGILLDPHSVDAWTDAIKKLLGNPAAASSLSERGLARAQQFSWDRCARETAAVLTVAGGGRAPFLGA